MTQSKLDKINSDIEEQKIYERKKFLGVGSSEAIAQYFNDIAEKDNLAKSGGDFIPASQIACTSVIVPNRTLNQYQSYFEAFDLNVKHGPKDLVLVLCINLARAAEVVGELRGLNLNEGVMPLFSTKEDDAETDHERKHLESPLSVAVTTPKRAKFLSKLKILDLNRVHRLVLDTSHFDFKNDIVLDIKAAVQLSSQVASNGGLIYLY